MCQCENKLGSTHFYLHHIWVKFEFDLDYLSVHVKGFKLIPILVWPDPFLPVLHNFTTKKGLGVIYCIVGKFGEVLSSQFLQFSQFANFHFTKYSYLNGTSLIF